VPLSILLLNITKVKIKTKIMKKLILALFIIFTVISCTPAGTLSKVDQGKIKLM